MSYKQIEYEDERKLSDIGNELHNISCALVHDHEEHAEHLASIAIELWLSLIHI